VTVRAHQWKLQELTRNLQHNPIKQSPRGGAHLLMVRSDGPEAVLTVRDQGPGIAAELRQRLFAPFSAGDTASGSGLGLAICREIVLALGGRISLDNRSAQENSAQVIGLDAVVRLPLFHHNA
jgi:two-component system sensor histidine kinase TctE